MNTFPKKMVALRVEDDVPLGSDTTTHNLIDKSGADGVAAAGRYAARTSTYSMLEEGSGIG